MKRREFIGACTIVGLGLAIGLPGEIYSQTPNVSVTSPSLGTLTMFASPRGGCTESGLTLYDKGPLRDDCFGLLD
ncbi:MAG: hypothetical protein DRP26_03190 [Candidatus Zixiibacteriota bacterium]|nr:MAG: hypothetical protein DRP26_03190 [candidate division Zixibacteria bacterium]